MNDIDLKLAKILEIFWSKFGKNEEKKLNIIHFLVKFLYFGVGGTCYFLPGG